MTLWQLLRDFFRTRTPLEPDDGLVVAFSGGTDSCALLALMRDFADELHLNLVAAHLDHQLDPASSDRAQRAAEIASHLNVPLILESTAVHDRLQKGESLEAGARRVRYSFLEKARQRVGARYIATAHHRDDQAETLLLRLAFGTGLDGLAGILPVHGTIVRPLLEASRRQLAGELHSRGLEPVEDPTNADLRYQRNRIRHRLLPRLESREPGLTQRLATLAGATLRTRAALDHRLAQDLDLRQGPQGEASLSLPKTMDLPEELLSSALSLLQRHCEAPYPISRAARRELRRQFLASRGLRLDCGSGWRLEAHLDRLWLYPCEPLTPFFSYTFRVPGTLEIPEIGARLQLRQERKGTLDPSGGARPTTSTQARLQLPLEPGDPVIVRNRRPGDRVHLAKSRSGRRLKEILIDLKVPRRHRDRLPLLCIGEDIVWIPGIAVRRPFDDGRQPTSWNAEILDL